MAERGVRFTQVFHRGWDQHPKCFTMWMGGGGIKPGMVHGEKDDFSYNIVPDPVHIRGINAALLHQLGIDHTRLSIKHLGLDLRLTGVEPVDPIHEIIA